jgi:hypothetical protein
VTEEGEAEVSVRADALEPVLGVGGSFFDGVGAQVGELALLQVAPDELDRVEVVGVAGEALDVGQERWDPIQAFMRPLR